MYREILNNPDNYNTDAVPYYSIIDPKNIELLLWDNDSRYLQPNIVPSDVILDYNGYDPDVQKFIDYLNDGLKLFEKRNDENE